MDDLLTSTLTITPGSVGGYDANGNWSETTAGTPFDIKCSIQPFKTMGKHRLVLPQGTTQTDVLTVYTRSAVKCGDLNKEPDTTFIKGFKYYAWREMDWSMVGLDLDHHEVYFIKILEEGWATPEPEEAP